MQQACRDCLPAHDRNLHIQMQVYDPDSLADVMFAIEDLPGLGCNSLSHAQEDTGGSCKSFLELWLLPPSLAALHSILTLKPTVYATATPV